MRLQWLEAEPVSNVSDAWTQYDIVDPEFYKGEEGGRW